MNMKPKSHIRKRKEGIGVFVASRSFWVEDERVNNRGRRKRRKNSWVRERKGK